jgi:hypothetical protein
MEGIMTASQIALYIVALILIACTLWNLYTMLTSKKRKAVAAAQFKQVMARLELDTLAVMKKKRLNFNEKHSFVNDCDEGILLCMDTEAKMLCLSRKNDIRLIPYDSIIGCEVFTHSPSDRPKLLSGVHATITTTQTGDEEIEVVFASKNHRRKSVIGKFIMDVSMEFADYVNGCVQPAQV